jgi:acyl-coenzyme A thioesterase PaaI-like protein
MSFWQRLASAVGSRSMLRAIRFYPPYLGAGIRLLHVDRELRSIEIGMKLARWNQNFVGTQFGGSLYSMCDPFYMLMLIHHLGPDYTVWDKSASIDFLKPGRGFVRARFELGDERLAQIRDEVQGQGKAHPRFEVTVVDDGGEPVARVSKLLSIRRRR